MAIADTTATGDIPLFRLGAVDSTNAAAWRYRAAGGTGEFAMVATHQTAGRGQWGRVWQSAPGGLFLSVGLGDRPDGVYPLAIAWGVAAQLQTQGVPVQLKWPNDLLLGGRKLGGLLVEGRSSDPEFTVVGLGLNWANPVPAGAARLADVPCAITDLEQLTTQALAGIHQGRSRWRGDRVGVLADWWQNLAGLALHQDGRRGQMVGILSTGELQVQWEDASQPQAYAPGTVRVGYNAAR
ncbi:MAG TPA: biotin--[acetyl-CoA-carboxylase] ligase [Cyanobacteria bacterium UBA8156]|jgi:BirA family biotin operon repressor/biotin-[acetyl-CoA-carboxylase] ligase|nr:biotin--[acetyl-CoA-carboxylase] ligase [Cyanobacteria bacterium UBA8156]